MDSFIDLALAAARRLGASDIHLKPDTRPILRIDGQLRTLKDEDVEPLGRDFLHNLSMSLLNDRRRDILERVGDVTITLATAAGIRLRVHIAQQRAGTGVVLRLIPSGPSALEALGFSETTRDQLRQMSEPGSGLLLVASGPGGGRTSTLAALVNDVASRRTCHIVTIENPVEILLKNRQSLVVQREVGLDVPSTAVGLRAAGRQDADLIMVGDLAEPEAAELALACAETDRLVVAGLAASSSASAAARLATFWDPVRWPAARARLAAVLRGVLCQRLVPGPKGKGRTVEAELSAGGAALDRA
jgi:twitching motility protein PilT